LIHLHRRRIKKISDEQIKTQVVNEGATQEVAQQPEAQALAVSPCGEVLSVNDQAGRLVLIMPDGRVSPFIQVISFQPPQTFLAFSPQGWYVVGESVPGFPSLLKRYLPNGVEQTLVYAIPAVSGVAVDKVLPGFCHGRLLKLIADVFTTGSQNPVFKVLKGAAVSRG
jgi:hypothetical protein